MRTAMLCLTTAAVLAICPIVSAGQWTTPVPVTEINTDYYEEWSPFMTSDGLSLYFSRLRNISPIAYGRIYEATRTEASGPFDQVTEVFSAPAGIHVTYPWLSPDELRMYFRVEDSSGWSLAVTQRNSTDDPWPQGTLITELNSLGNYTGEPRLTADELTICFSRLISGRYDTWIATRSDRNSPFGNARSLTEINSTLNDKEACISADGLEVIFASDRDHAGAYSLYMATRSSLSDPFGNIQHLSLFDTPGGGSNHPFLSSDGQVLYYMRDLGFSSRDIYVSYYIPEPGTIALLGLGMLMLRRRVARA